MKKTIHHLLFLLLITISLNACEDKKNITPEDQKKFRTVVVYISANNNLQEEAYKNINQMEKGLGTIDGNLIVYAKLPNKNPVLYHIKNDSSDDIISPIIKEYDNHNSSDPQIMKMVLEDIKKAYPAETYGLTLWSHATGWIPNTTRIKLKSFGNDNGQEMNITDLNSAIPYHFDFIMFDACSMASVEVLYEIKDKATVFIASPGEVISNGMPYQEIVNDLFSKDSKAYQLLSEKYYNHYMLQSGLKQSATISVVKSEHLATLALNTKNLLSQQSQLFDDFRRETIQRMDFDRYYNPLIAFDFKNFIETNYSESIQRETLINTLNKTIVYKANTPKFNGYDINLNSGLTCYIPHIDNQGTTHEFYKKLKWYKDSGFDKIFDKYL